MGIKDKVVGAVKRAAGRAAGSLLEDAGKSAKKTVDQGKKAVTEWVDKRTTWTVGGAAAYGAGGSYERDLGSKKDTVGLVILGAGIKGSAATPNSSAGGTLNFRLWRIAEWNGGNDAPVDMKLEAAAGPLGLEIQFDPGGSLDLVVKASTSGEGAYAGASITFDDTLIPD